MLAVLERVRAVEQALLSKQHGGAGTFGLLHADLHHHHLLFEDDSIRALDFDDCGFGPVLFDPAVTLNELRGWPQYPALRAALLRGYRRLRPLSAEHEAFIDTFVALRVVQDGLWFIERRQHPAIMGDWRAAAHRAMSGLPGLLSMISREPAT